MGKTIQFNHETCTQCGLCAEVCPNRILYSDESGKLATHAELVELCFECAQCMAVCKTKSVFVNGYSYENDFFPLPDVNNGANTFRDLIFTRRAIRNFTSQPVPKALLEKIVEAISYAPPSLPPQKIKLVVVQSKETIRMGLPFMITFYENLTKVIKNPIVKRIIRKEVGAEKFSTLNGHVIPLMKIRMPKLLSGEEDTITRGAPAMILFLAEKGQDASSDILIAATYGMIASHSLGLGGSIMDLIPPAINRELQLQQLFEIPKGHSVVSALIIGYPKINYQRGIKKQTKEVTWLK